MTNRPAKSMLRTEGLYKLYPDGDVHALNGVTLDIPEGEYAAIIGPSGSGKSTLLNMLGALDRPDRGEVYFQGEALSKRRDLDRFRARQIGFVFQSFYLLPTLTSLENVQVPMFEGPRLGRRERVRKAHELLELVGLAKRAKHRPLQLSVGERQRVALARALANDPALLLADEPTGNLDSDNAAHVLDLFDAFQRDRGITLIVITHSADVAARANRVITMRDGQVVKDSADADVPMPDAATTG